MSVLTADPGFARGQVLGVMNTNTYGGNVGDGSHLLGVRKTFRDEHPRTGVLQSNHTVDCICVKNTSGSAILPGQVVTFSSSAILTEVAPTASASDIMMGVADEYLPTAGVPDDEVFWVVVNGPSTVVKTNTSVAAGAWYGPSSTAGSAVAVSTNERLGVAIATSATGTGRILVKTVAGN